MKINDDPRHIVQQDSSENSGCYLVILHVFFYYSFVTYKHPDDANTAIEKFHRHYLGNNYIDVSLSTGTNKKLAEKVKKNEDEAFYASLYEPISTR